MVREHGHGVLGILHSIENSVLRSGRIDSIDKVLTSIEQARRALLKDMRETLEAEAMEEANRMAEEAKRIEDDAKRKAWAQEAKDLLASAKEEGGGFGENLGCEKIGRRPAGS